MKKLLFLIGSLQGGGAEKVLIDTVNALDHRKYQITVQTLFNDDLFREKLADHVRYKTIIPFPKGLLRRMIAKILFHVLSVRIVYQVFVRDDYDYEIAFLEGLPTKVIAKSTNQKAQKFAWIHTDLKAFPDSYRAFGSEEKEENTYHYFDKIFCVSNAVKDAFLSKYPSVTAPVITLYNILDEEAIVAASREDVVFPTSIRPCFISVGRLAEQKGYDRLLRIHKRLLEEGFVHALLLIGEGSLRSSLEEYIEQNRLEKSAFLLGFQSNPYKYVSKADLFVCSSYAEGFSMVISESVLCGTPVLATDVAGNRGPEEAHRCSVIVRNDEDALYEALLEVLREPQKLKTYRNELPSKQSLFRKEKLLAAFEEAVFDA